MKTLSLKLDEDIFNETEGILVSVKKSRNRYINEAVDYYNKFQKRGLLAGRLKAESKLTGKESLNVAMEFEKLDG